MNSRSRVLRTLRIAISAPANSPLPTRNASTIRISDAHACRRGAYRICCDRDVDAGSRRGATETPQREAHAYITPEGAKKLRAELDQLWTVERPRVTQEVADAAAQGDRSENAEYIYGKRRLREIDRRVRFLSKRLDEVTVVNEPPSDPQARVLRRVGHASRTRTAPSRRTGSSAPTSPTSSKGCISIDSPVARALLGKREGDEVTVRVPEGRRRRTRSSA